MKRHRRSLSHSLLCRCLLSQLTAPVVTVEGVDDCWLGALSPTSSPLLCSPLTADRQPAWRAARLQLKSPAWSGPLQAWARQDAAGLSSLRCAVIGNVTSQYQRLGQTSVVNLKRYRNTSPQNYSADFAFVLLNCTFHYYHGADCSNKYVWTYVQNVINPLIVINCNPFHPLY